MHMRSIASTICDEATAVSLVAALRQFERLEPERTRLTGPLQIEQRESRAADRIDLGFDESGIGGRLFRQAEIRNRILELADVEMKFGLEHRRLQNQWIPQRRFQAVGIGDGAFAQVARFMIGVHRWPHSGRPGETSARLVRIPLRTS